MARLCADLDDDCAFGATPTAPVTSWTYRLDGSPSTRVDPLGKVWTYDRAWAPGGGRTATVTSPEGRVSEEAYDGAGRLLSASVGLASNPSAWAEREYGYDDLGRLVWETDADGVRTSYGYDEDGNRISRTVGPNPTDAAHTWTTVYDLRGRATSELGPSGDEDASGNPVRLSTTTSYDGADRVVRRTEGSGADALTTSWSFDATGRLRYEVTDIDGDAHASDPGSTNPADRDADDRVVETTWTDAGRPESVVVGPQDVASFDWQAGVGKRTTTWAYDDAGRVVEVVDPTGTSTATYTADGHLERWDGPGATWSELGYDAAGRVLSVATPSPTGTGDVVATTTWNDRGEVTARTEAHTATDPSPPTATWTYDDDGLTETVTNPLGTANDRVTYGYDDWGNLETRSSWANSDPTAPTVYEEVVETWTSTPGGRPATEEDPLGRTTTFTHDDLGRLAETTYPSGRVETTTWWSAGTRRASTWTLSGSPTITDEASYDSRGRRQEVTGTKGTIATTWDRAGNPTSITGPGPGGTATATLGYGWDQHGGRRAMTHPDGTEFSFTHDPAGRLTQTAVDISTTSTPVWWPLADYDHDAEGRPTTATLNGPVGTSELTYSGNGAVEPVTHSVDIGTTDRETTLAWRDDGRLASEAIAGSGTRSYGYDEAGQLTSRTGLGGAYGFTYTSRGQRQTMSSPSGVTVGYAYDDAGQLTSTTPSSGAGSTYTSDADGRRLVSSTGGTPVRTDTWDAAGRLDTSVGGGVTIDWVQDPDGTLLGATSPSGFSLGMTWDHAGGVPEIVDFRSGSTVARLNYGLERLSLDTSGGSVFYAHDHQGSVIPAGGISAPAEYDPYGRPTNPSFAGGLFFGYRGELHVLGQVHLRNREYDPAVGAFVSPDPLEGIEGAPTLSNPYHYADNDPVNKVDPLGLSASDDDCGAARVPLVCRYGGPFLKVAWTLFGASAAYISSHAGNPYGGACGGGAATAVWFAGNDIDDINNAAIGGCVTGAGVATGNPGVACAAGAAGSIITNDSFDLEDVAVGCGISAGGAVIVGRVPAGSSGGAGPAASLSDDIDDLLRGARQHQGRFPRDAGPGEILVRRGQNGQVTNYQIYGADGLPVKRVDLVGRPHNGVPTPHVVEFERNVNPSTGREYLRPGDDVRAARPDEVPGR